MGKLLELSKDLHELLLTQEEFKLPLSAVISEYQLWFGKKTPFDPVVYGFTSIVTLLEALPALAQVSTCRCGMFVKYYTNMLFGCNIFCNLVCQFILSHY